MAQMTHVLRFFRKDEGASTPEARETKEPKESFADTLKSFAGFVSALFWLGAAAPTILEPFGDRFDPIKPGENKGESGNGIEDLVGALGHNLGELMGLLSGGITLREIVAIGVTTLAGRWIGRTAHIPILGLIALLFVVYVMSAPEATL